MCIDLPVFSLYKLQVEPKCTLSHNSKTLSHGLWKIHFQSYNRKLKSSPVNCFWRILIGCHASTWVWKPRRRRRRAGRLEGHVTVTQYFSTIHRNYNFKSLFTWDTLQLDTWYLEANCGKIFKYLVIHALIGARNTYLFWLQCFH